MAGQPTSGSLCALWLQRTATTVATRSPIHDVTVFIIGVLAQQPLVAGADIRIAVRFIAKLLAPEEFAIALIINCAHDGNMWDHACRFAFSELFSIGVTRIRHYLETVYPECSLCGLS